MMTLMQSVTYKLFFKNYSKNAKRIFLATTSNKITQNPNNSIRPKKGIKFKPIIIQVIKKNTKQIKFEVFLSIPTRIAMRYIIDI